MFQLPMQKAEHQEQQQSKTSHKRTLTPADLNKPLPPVLVRVPFKIQVDRTFSWNKLDGRRTASVGSSATDSKVWPSSNGS
jgi:hypothetical protein